MKKSFLFMKLLFFAVFLTSQVQAQTVIIDPATAGAFEGASFTADGWTVLNNATAGASWVQSTGATAGFTGSQCAYITSNTAGTPPPHTYTNSPTSRVSALYRDVTIPSGETSIQLSFSWINLGESGFDRLQVWAVPTSFTPLNGTASMTTTGSAPTGRLQLGTGATGYVGSGSWTTANITIPAAYAGTTFRLVFQWRNDTSGGLNPPIAIDNVSLTSSCSGAVTAAATSILSTSATLNAATFAGATGYNFRYRAVGSPTWTMAPGNPYATTSAPVTGLTGNTTYEFQVAADGPVCNSYSASANFFTGYCVATGTSGSTQITNVSMTGLTNLNNTSAGNAGYGNFTATTPTVSQIAGGTVSLTLTYSSDPGTRVFIDWNNDLDFADAGETVYSSNAYVLGTVSGSFTVPGAQAAGNYRMRVVADWNSTTPVACPVGINGETEDYTFTVAPPPTCYAPTGLTNTATSTTSVNHSWTAPTSGTTPAGYEWALTTSATPPASGTATAGTTATSSSLTPNTTYYLHVRSDCGGGDISAWATSASVFTGYCNPGYTSGTPDGDLISNVTIVGTTLDNFSGTVAGLPSYTYYTGAANLTGDLSAGTSYTVSVSNGAFGNQNMAAWIDFNDNLVFEPSEKIGFTTASMAANTTATFTISLPCNPSIGVHRMRIRDVWNLAGSSIDPCATYGWGETEDYDVNVLAPPPCPAISSLANNSVTSSSANITWTAGCVETTWDVDVSTSATPSGTPSNPGVTSTTFAASSLSANTLYFVHVRANCGGGNGESVWSTTSFTTLPNPPSCVTNPIATPDPACDNQNLVFSWDAEPTATSYSITVGTTPGGTDIANNLNVGTNLSITFLDPTINTTYYWTVIPSNVAGAATGCVEQSYLTGSDLCVCTPLYSTGTAAGDLISNVSITGTSLSNNVGFTAGQPSYLDFFNSVVASQSGQMSAGSTYTVNVSTGEWGNQGIRVWIDFNNDNVFDPSESVGSSPTTIGSGFTPGVVNASASFPISLPCNPTPGDYRMRVRGVYATNGPTIDPCIQYTWGQTHDYKVTILPPPPCPQITGLAASNITSSSADITWVVGCTETAWDVHVSTSAIPPASPANVGVTSTTFAASSLTSNTLYYAHVRANCGGGNGVSAWSTISFTTALAPPSNDECAGAISFGTISVTPSCQVVELGAATLSEPICNGFGATNDVWYTFTVPASAGPSAEVFYSTTNNSGSADRVFELLTGCGGFSIDCSDLESGSFTVAPGTYTLRTHTYFSGVSNFNLCLYLTPPVPSNDDICSAQTIKSTGGTSMNTYSLLGDMTCDNRTANTASASATGATEASCGGTNGKSVWYRFTTPACVVGGVVPFQIEMTTDNALTTFDTKLAIYSSSDGTCNGTLTSIACNDDLASTLTSCGGNTPNTSTILRSDLLPNTNYFVLVDGYFGGSGIIEVSGRVLAAPHTAVSNTPTSVTLTTPDKGASLYSYYYKQVGSVGYSLMNSASLTDTRTLPNGVSYQTQVMYRCTAAASQFYRTPVVTVAVPSIAACTPVTALDCAPGATAGDYTITWPQVGGLFTNGGLLSGYQIYYRVIGASGYNLLSNPTVTCAGGVCSYSFTGLTNPAGYEFWIKTRCSSTVLLQSNIATCAGAKSAIGATYTFVNPTTGAEYYDMPLTEDWNNFGLTFSDLGDYYIGINKDNEIYAVKTAEANMIHAGTDVSFELVPNPTNASTTMTFNNTIKSGTFQVVDAMGREVLSGNISNTNAVELDGSKWNAGVYLVQVTTNDKTTMRRLVVSK